MRQVFDTCQYVRRKSLTGLRPGPEQPSLVMRLIIINYYYLISGKGYPHKEVLFLIFTKTVILRKHQFHHLNFHFLNLLEISKPTLDTVTTNSSQLNYLERIILRKYPQWKRFAIEYQDDMTKWMKTLTKSLKLNRKQNHFTQTSRMVQHTVIRNSI